MNTLAQIVSDIEAINKLTVSEESSFFHNTLRAYFEAEKIELKYSDDFEYDKFFAEMYELLIDSTVSKFQYFTNIEAFIALMTVQYFTIDLWSSFGEVEFMPKELLCDLAIAPPAQDDENMQDRF